MLMSLSVLRGIFKGSVEEGYFFRPIFLGLQHLTDEVCKSSCAESHLIL